MILSKYFVFNLVKELLVPGFECRTFVGKDNSYMQ
uniref:Uncharacterized protein n=1 Tax=Arundo donax TaxID=35708 RepID=A0A0A9GZP6_ARUDO